MPAAAKMSAGCVLVLGGRLSPPSSCGLASPDFCPPAGPAEFFGSKNAAIARQTRQPGSRPATRITPLCGVSAPKNHIYPCAPRVFAVMNSRTVLPESPQKKARQDRALQYENMACASHAPAGGGCRPSGFSESSAFCRAFFLPSPVFFLFFATAEKQRKITGIREIFRFFQKKMHFPCRAPVFFKKTLTIEGPNLIFMFVAILHLKNCF